MNDGDDENDMVHHCAANAAIDFLFHLALGKIMEIPSGVGGVLDGRNGDDMQENLKYSRSINVLELNYLGSLTRLKKIDLSQSISAVAYSRWIPTYLLVTNLST